MAGATVLIVDDDEHVRVPLALIVRREGYRVLVVESAEAALAELGEESIAVILCDQRLRGMSGVEFLREARERWPDAVRILLTADTFIETALRAINEGHVYRYMLKPWNNDELRTVLRESVRFSELMRENRRLVQLTTRQALEFRALNQTLEQKVAERTAAIERQNRHLEDHLLDVVRLLASVQEVRNSAMAGHAARMAAAARGLCRLLHVPEAQWHDIEIAAALHDLGKLGLPDRLLAKNPFGLSREESDLVRQTPLLGQTLLSTIPSLHGVAAIVRSQGEWYNGNGYPDGLAGEAIPIGARIVAVVEQYENGATREVLQQSAGRRCDPRVVQAFLRYLDEKKVTQPLDVERTLGLTDLAEGMVLTRDLYTGRGLLLAASGRVLDGQTLEKIRNFNQVDPIANNVFVRA